MRLLVVNDDENAQRNIACCARDAGFSKEDIDKYFNKKDAIAAIASNVQHELSVMDINLTGRHGDCSGFDVIKAQRLAAPDSKIICMSSYATDSGITAIRSGADDFVSTGWPNVNYMSLLVERLKLWKGFLEERKSSTT